MQTAPDCLQIQEHLAVTYILSLITYLSKSDMFTQGKDLF